MPREDDINQPQPDSEEPYFTTWVTQQAVDKFGADRVFGGGMEIKTTLDPELQAAAESAVAQISGVGPSASLVTIENATGEVKAMVGGENFRERPFNLATNGHRQPGSAFKPFILLTALEQGNYGPGSVFASQPKDLPVHEQGRREGRLPRGQLRGPVPRLGQPDDRHRPVGQLRLRRARHEGRAARTSPQEATDMGIRTELSTNPAMLLGGLKEGVTPLEMAFAYSTLANSGKRVCAEWASYKCGPVAIKGVEGEDKPERKTKEVFSQEVADTAKTMLSYVISSGTGTRAQVGEFAAGKTGTTENYGDAWFCGFIDKYTTCVWVGYADKVQSMETEYNGGPVAGGTWPASIWQSFMSQAIAIRDTARGREGGRGRRGRRLRDNAGPGHAHPRAGAGARGRRRGPAPGARAEQPAPQPTTRPRRPRPRSRRASRRRRRSRHPRPSSRQPRAAGPSPAAPAE